MYRLLIFLAAAAAAPQDDGISYIKTQPHTEEPPAYTSSLIEIPLSVGSTQDSEYVADDSGSRQDEVETTESTEDSTVDESTETEATTVTERYQPKTTPKFKKSPPKFYSKLSYFEKPNLRSASPNLVERAGRRRFRSNCRCEKISNCPKLQITVPRCPEGQFMCCF